LKPNALALACAASAVLGFGVRAEQSKPRYEAATIKRCQPEENPAPAERQLGLKLEKVKAPRGLIVIDHIERPSPDTFDSRPMYWYKLYHDKTS